MKVLEAEGFDFDAPDAEAGAAINVAIAGMLTHGLPMSALRHPRTRRADIDSRQMAHLKPVGDSGVLVSDFASHTLSYSSVEVPAKALREYIKFRRRAASYQL